MRNHNFKKTSQDYLEFKGKTCWEPWIKVKSYNCLFLTVMPYSFYVTNPLVLMALIWV